MDPQKNRQRRARRLGILLRVCAVLPFAFMGCADTWDQVSSRDFHVKDWFSDPPDPFVVLKTSDDGDKRARALSALGEHAAQGGDQQQHDAVVQILVTAATSEQRSLCRIKAIEAMRNFNDVRVVKGLEEAYERAGAFPPETATIIRLVSIQALGETRSPAAVDFLVKVLNQPQVAEKGGVREKQTVNDERIAAARSLGHFKGGKPAAALVAALEQNRDVALRDRLQESLAASTGKTYGLDVKLWSDYVQKEAKDQPIAVVDDRGVGEKILDTVSPVNWLK